MTDRDPPTLDTQLAALRRLADIATALGADRVRTDADALVRRVAEGRFYVACLGEFKRGKSTLVNALVGQSVLPMGIVPVTTVPTVVQYGDSPAARVRLTSGEERVIALRDLDSYVSEAKNPRNERGVDGVEVFVPSPLLRDGLCLVDTPGLGSVFQENTAATHAFVPQIDAALMVIGVDPPLSGDELRLMEVACAHVAHCIVVLNKSDRFTTDERREATRFASEVLVRQFGRPSEPILEVSAGEQLSGFGPARDWQQLIARLTALGGSPRRALVRGALDRGVTRIARQCLRELEQAHAALFRPLAESDQLVEALQRRVGDTAHESLQLGFRMEHAADALQRAAAHRREEFLERALPRARQELAGDTDGTPIRFGPALRRYAMHRAAEIATRHLLPWLVTEQAAAEPLYQRRVDRALDEARALLARAAEIGGLDAADLCRELEPADRFRVPATTDWSHAIPPAPRPPRPPRAHAQWLRDVASLRGRRRRAITRDATRVLDTLLAVGAQTVEDDLDRRLGCTARALRDAVYALLRDVYEGADRAVARARAVHEEGAAALEREGRRLAQLRGEVQALAAPRPRGP